MIELLMTNLQAVLMGAAALTAGVYALTGFTRVATEDGETRIAYKEGRMKRNLAVAGILVGLMATVTWVPRGYVGVIYDWQGGILQDERPEGVQFMIPFKQHVTNVDVRVKEWVFNDENVYVHTNDLHEIRVPFAVNYRVNPDEASYVLQNVAGDPAQVILSHAALTSLRTEVGQVKLDALAQQVATIAAAVEDTIRPQAERNGLELQYVAIEDTVIDGAYVTAVRDERISERNIRTAQNNAAAAEFTADQVRVEAAGQADAINTLAAAREAEQTRLGMTATEYVYYSRWNGVLPTTLLGTGAADLLLDLPESTVTDQ